MGSDLAPDRLISDFDLLSGASSCSDKGCNSIIYKYYISFDGWEVRQGLLFPDSDVLLSDHHLVIISKGSFYQLSGV